jgi:multidrug efflux pump subunit AcrB
MKGLIVLCVRRPVSVIMALAALCIAAVFSVSKLPLDRLPEMSVPRVTVETVYPGMAAEELRSLVTIPVEDALSPVKGLERMRSVSRDGRSLVSMDFRWGTDPMAASVLVREAVDAVYPGLPEGVRKPSVSGGGAGDEPHAVIAVVSRNGDGGFARRLAGYELRSRLRRIDGAGSVILAGGEEAEERLRLDVPRLAALGISPPDFVRLLAGETADIPAGNAREGDRELVVVSAGRPASAAELAELILPAGNGGLRVGDAGLLAREKRRRESIFVFDGREAAALEIYRRPGADPLRLSGEIQKVLDEAAPLFSRDAEIILVRDSAPSLLAGVTGLLISAALAAAAVISVLLVFIRRLRYSLLAAFSIPVSAAAGICALALAGRSLNSMSLGGLALGIGLVSDTGVMMLDLLHRSFTGRRPDPEETGRRAASIAGSSAASTLTTAVVFVPVIFLPGPLGSLFGDTALALTASIFSGWLYAQFCLPPLYRLFSAKGEKPLCAIKVNGADKRGIGLENRYRRLLAPVLRRPAKIFAPAVLASAAGILLLLPRPAVFISPDEAEDVRVSAVFPPGTLLDAVESAGVEMTRLVSALPSIRTVYGRAGAEEEDLGSRADTGYRKEELILRCVPERGIRPEKAREEIKKALEQSGLAGAEAEVSVYLPRDRTEVLLGLSSAGAFTVRGTNREETVQRAAAAASRLKAAHIPVIQRPRGLRPELRLYPNREAAAALSLTAAGIAENLYILNEGAAASRLEIEGRPLDVRVTGGTDMAAEDIPILARNGKRAYLGSLGRIERLEAEAALARLDRSDVIYLDTQVPLDPAARNALNDAAARFPWFAGADESVFSRYRNSLVLNLCLVLILLYMTMGAQFESFLLPVVLMLTIPFSLAGAGPALLIFGAGLDSGAVLGLTALFGIVVNNSLVLFEASDEKIRAGRTAAAAVYSGAAERLRPVLITAATTVFALLPLALLPMGASQKSMAAAMLGGIAASTLLSLFALPPVLVRFFAWRENQ